MTTGAVTGVVDALKTQPLALALVIMNIALLAIFYIIVHSAENRHKMNAEQQKHLIELLAHCRGGAP